MAKSKSKPAAKSDPRAVSVIDKRIGAQIRARRVALGMSQERLGELIGVTFQQVQKYERGINRVSAATLYEIVSALDLRVESLFPADANEGVDAVLTDPDAARLVEVFARLNENGRRVMMSIARTLANDAGLLR